MYIINTEPLSGINPRMHSGGHGNRLGDLGRIALALADIGRLHTTEPNPILLRSAKLALQ